MTTFHPDFAYLQPKATPTQVILHLQINTTILDRQDELFKKFARGISALDHVMKFNNDVGTTYTGTEINQANAWTLFNKWMLLSKQEHCSPSFTLDPLHQSCSFTITDCVSSSF